jgi:hypothetical protein
MAKGYIKKDSSKKVHPVHALAEKWRQTGRLAFDRPIQKRYSLNGGASKTYDDTHKYLKDFFKDK